MTAERPSRRDFITALGAAAVTCSDVARGEESAGRRRVGVLMNLMANDPEGWARDAAFREALTRLGWIEGRNVQIDYRWGGADAARYRKFATELVALGPDVLLAGGGQVVAPLRQAAGAIPIVFTNTNDPLALGFVASLSRPGGNVTGFINIEYGISGKWLELLTQIHPGVARAAALWDSGFPGGKAQLAELTRVAPTLRLQLTPIDLRDPESLERTIGGFSREADGGLVVTASTLATLRRKQIISLASQYRLPAVYCNRLYVEEGGLISYGPDFLDQYRRAADYIDRILKGAQPADLPVEAPRVYETVLNAKIANELGLKVPRIVLLKANKVIE